MPLKIYILHPKKAKYGRKMGPGSLISQTQMTQQWKHPEPQVNKCMHLNKVCYHLSLLHLQIFILS